MNSYLQIGVCLIAAIVMVSGRPQYHGYPAAYYGAPAVPGAYGHYGAPGVPVQDTPEVAHAKAAHLAALAAAAAAAGGHHGGHQHGGYYGGGADHSGAYIHDPSGDHALPYIHDPSGDHDVPYNHYGGAGAYGGHAGAYGGHAGAYYGQAAVPGIYNGGYYGIPGAHPYAPHGLPVPVQDTPEVAAAKAAHFAAHAAAKGHHYG